MRNGGQAQQTAVMAPPHLNGSAQFVSAGYVGYVARQSWGQFQGGPQHPRNTARPLSHPPPPPSRRGESQRASGNGSANPKSASLLHSSKPGTHRSTTPSVSSSANVSYTRNIVFLSSYSFSFLREFARILFKLLIRNRRGEDCEERKEGMELLELFIHLRVHVQGGRLYRNLSWNGLHAARF